ncbi:unnamed protein product [Withania somnifera]
MNHSVPDFEMEDDYSMPTSSGLTRPKKSSMTADEEIMELLWQNGQVVLQSQNQRSLKKSHNGSGGSGDAVIPSDKSAGREIRHVEETTTQHLFMQEDEMASWLHYPLDYPSSFERDLYSDFLYPTLSSTVTTAALPRESRTSMVEIRPPVPQPSPTAPIGTAPRPPIPPSRRLVTDSSNRFRNFGHFSRLPRTKSEPGRANFSISERDSMVVDSKETPTAGKESRVSHVADNVVQVPGGNVGGSTINGTGTTSTSTTIREQATICELSITSSPGGSGDSVSASAEPPTPSHKAAATALTAAATDYRKRKGRETDDGEGQNEDADFESPDTKKQARGSTSTKRSRAAEVHNLSERRRRDRINEKMRTLQELIPRCNKTDKASMLDEAIEYLKSLQLQVQMMSMGCGMVLMMYPGMQQYMPPMGMGMGMGMGMEIGMNRPMVPYPPLLPGATVQNAAAAAQMGPRFPIPPFHLPPVPVPAQSRMQASSQPDVMLNPLVAHNPNQPRLLNFNDPYQQFFSLQQAQVTLPQNQEVEQPSNNKSGSSKEVGNPGNHQSG